MQPLPKSKVLVSSSDIFPQILLPTPPPPPPHPHPLMEEGMHAMGMSLSVETRTFILLRSINSFQHSKNTHN